jgi:hypothetical protein
MRRPPRSRGAKALNVPKDGVNAATNAARLGVLGIGVRLALLFHEANMRDTGSLRFEAGDAISQIEAPQAAETLVETKRLDI